MCLAGYLPRIVSQESIKMSERSKLWVYSGLRIIVATTLLVGISGQGCGTSSPGGSDGTDSDPTSEPNASPEPQPSDDEVEVFDITISATTDQGGGGVVSGTLEIGPPAQGQAGFPEQNFANIVIKDDHQAGADGAIPLPGGVFIASAVTMFTISQGQVAVQFFDVTESNGTVTGTLTYANTMGEHVNVFVTLFIDEVFDGNLDDVIAQMQTGSTFSYTITGDSVSGQISATGYNPFNVIAEQTYTATFTGTRRP